MNGTAGNFLQPSKSLNLPEYYYGQASQEEGNEYYLSTPEKKAKYNQLAKDLATKLAFKNLKTQIFKH